MTPAQAAWAATQRRRTNPGVMCTLDSGDNYAAVLWDLEHPDDDRIPCCEPSAYKDATHCVCWAPVYTGEQAPPQPPTGPGAIATMPACCGDCAWRPGSPERADDDGGHLADLVAAGTPFWCHTGLRRPAHYAHPDGRTVLATVDDYRPLIADGLPYQTDGSPALLCAGWAAAYNAQRRRR